MEKLCLVTPSLEHKEAYNNMMIEWKATKERIYPGAIRSKGANYTTLLERLESSRRRETCPPNYVPSDTFFLINEHDRILGAISIRHYLNNELLNVSGHIGYGIRPSERRKGYAAEMLKMALEKCENKGMTRILLTCNKDNIASAKTIIANGGVYENELTEEDGNIVQRYWINLK